MRPRTGKPFSYCRVCDNARLRANDAAEPRQVFRQVVSRARRDAIKCNVTPRDLLQLWRDQKGLCALSGLPMTFKQGRLLLTSVSVDRIVARKGYVRGNVQLVCAALNALKGSASEDEAFVVAAAFVDRRRALATSSH